MPDEPFRRDPFRSGMVLLASQLNAIANKVVSKIEGGKDIKARAFGDKVILESTKSAEPILTLDAWFVVTAIRRDIFEGKEWDFDTGAARVGAATTLIAKLRDIRGTTWSGKTIGGVAYVSTDGSSEVAGHTTRTADGAAETIAPTYIAGVSVIQAKRMNTTGVSYAGTRVYWQDVTPRKWDGSSSATSVYMRWEHSSTETIADGTSILVPLDGGAEEKENTGGGFEITANKTVKILAGADGLLCSIIVTLEFRNVSWQSPPRIDVLIFVTVPGPTRTQIGGHSWPKNTVGTSLIGSTFFSLNCCLVRRFNLNDEIDIEIFFDSANAGNTTRLEGNGERTHVTCRVVP